MKILKYLLTFLVLPAAIVALVWFIVQSILVPVDFDKQVKDRKEVAIQRLKDIRTLQVAYKSVNGRYTASMDSLIMFYNNGKMNIVMQIGSTDDSLAVANTEKLKKANKKITPEEMYQLYKKGENLVFAINHDLPVRDTLFHNRQGFVVDSLKYIPFSGGQLVEMEAIVRQVSGVVVPLFEAKMPFELLLKGLNKQLIINLVYSKTSIDQYPGLMVGSIDTPNNNAGNWE